MATVPLKSALKKESKYSSASNKRARESPKITLSTIEKIHEYDKDETLDEMITDIHHIYSTLDIFFKKPIINIIKEAGINGPKKHKPVKKDQEDEPKEAEQENKIDDQYIYRNIHRVLKPIIKTELVRFHQAYIERINTEQFKSLSPEIQQGYKNASNAKFTEIQSNDSSKYVIKLAKELVDRGKYTPQQILQEYFAMPEENKTSILNHFIFVLMHLGLPDILKFKNFCNNKCHRVAEYIKTHTLPENLHEYPSNSSGQNLISECQALVNFIKLSLRITDVERFDRLLREVTDNRCTFLKNNEYTPEHFARAKENDRRSKEARAAQKRERQQNADKLAAPSGK